MLVEVVGVLVIFGASIGFVASALTFGYWLATGGWLR